MRLLALTILTAMILISCSSENYEILNEDISMNVSRIDVKLNEEVDEEELKRISTEIRKSRKKYDKVWISFYLQDYLPESGISPWALGSFSPDLEVEISGKKKTEMDEPELEFPQHESVVEMLATANDYTGPNFELLSETPLHVRVSKEFVKGESEEVMTEQTKRDIVYISFQAFATTNIDRITVTSIPITRESFNPNLPYDGKLQNKLKLTKTLSREKAKAILEKYLKTSSFEELYQFESGMFMLSDKFDLLRYGQLENVFRELD